MYTILVGTPQGQSTLGTVLGVIFGILAATVIIIAIVILIFIVNKKSKQTLSVKLYHHNLNYIEL